MCRAPPLSGESLLHSGGPARLPRSESGNSWCLPLSMKQAELDARASPPRVRQALVSAAARITTPDSFANPRQLIRVDSSPIIIHLLRGLQVAGIQRAVITLGHAAQLLANEIRQHSFGEMSVEFVWCEASSWKRGHASNILAARSMFVPVSTPPHMHTRAGATSYPSSSLLPRASASAPHRACAPHAHGSTPPRLRVARAQGEPLLMVMSDHIFNQRLLRQCCTAELAADMGAAVLIDDSSSIIEWARPGGAHCQAHCKNGHCGSIVKVTKGERGLVSRIGKKLAGFDAIEAGVYVVRPDVFDVLHRLLVESMYCTLAEAMQVCTRRARAAPPRPPDVSRAPSEPPTTFAPDLPPTSLCAMFLSSVRPRAAGVCHRGPALVHTHRRLRMVWRVHRRVAAHPPLFFDRRQARVAGACDRLAAYDLATPRGHVRILQRRGRAAPGRPPLRPRRCHRGGLLECGRPGTITRPRGAAALPSREPRGLAAGLAAPHPPPRKSGRQGHPQQSRLDLRGVGGRRALCHVGGPCTAAAQSRVRIRMPLPARDNLHAFILSPCDAVLERHVPAPTCPDAPLPAPLARVAATLCA